MLFSIFPYDYYVLWATPQSGSLPATALLQLNATITQPASEPAREPYLQLLESHLRFLHQSPPIVSRILHMMIGTGFLGLLLKLYKPSEANMLFDGASLVLWVCAVAVYVSNIVKGLRIVSTGAYGDVSALTEAEKEELGETALQHLVGREDSLKVMAASNTILALVLMGVLVLQAGQWYAQRKEAQEVEAMDKVAKEKDRRRSEGGSGRSVEGVKGGGEGKKRQ
ncbi:MAG: hypothetical protein Q9162_007253 [Coniocarpon cinnabarinum]